MFKLPATQGKEEFLSAIRNGLQKDMNPERFRLITSNFNYSDERAYPCVDVMLVAEDKAPQTKPATNNSLLLQSKSLYCRHPARPETGFSIIYSFRGPDIYATLDSEALEFIEGVQVPNK